MTKLVIPSILRAGVLLIGTIVLPIGQVNALDSDAHHPDTTEAAPKAPASATPGAMRGMMTPEMMGLMTPEMVGMMRMMMQHRAGHHGMDGAGMPPDRMGPGMMARGQMPMVGGMMMNHATPRAPGARTGAGAPNMMGAIYGSPHDAPEMTPERVRAFLEKKLASHDNPRLTLGEIAIADDGSITAEIVTVDGSLVQKLAFNRYPGLFRQITE